MSARRAAVGVAGPAARLRALNDRHRSLGALLVVGAVAGLLPVAAQLPPLTWAQPTTAWIDSFTGAGIIILLALGLNIVVGFAGLLDLGYAAFFAIGAYAWAFVGSSFGNSVLGIHVVEMLGAATGVLFWPMLAGGAAIAALFGVLLGAPTLRLRGDYLAIVTLGFGEIVPIVLLNADAATNGTNGITGIARPWLPGLGIFPLIDPWPFYLTMVALVALGVVACLRLAEGRTGRAWDALRSDEVAAAASGVNTVAAKLLAFGLGASVAGIAGVFSAAKLVTVSPDQFGFVISFVVLTAVVLGGMGSVWGAIAGALAVYLVQNVGLKLLDQVLAGTGIPLLASIDFVQLQALLFGVLLLVFVLVRPAGILPRRRMRLAATVGAGGPAAGPADPDAIPRPDDPSLLASSGERDDPAVADRARATHPSSSPLLAVRGVSRAFGGLQALDRVDLEVPTGAIVSVIGPNGAGKTTLFDLIAGQVAPDQGSVELRGVRLIGAPVRTAFEPLVWAAPLLLAGLPAVTLAAAGLVSGPLAILTVGLLVLGAPAVVLLAAATGAGWYRRLLTRLGIHRSARPAEMVTAGVARTFQNIRLFRDVTIMENVLIGMHVRLGASAVDALLDRRRARDEEVAAVGRARALLALVGIAADPDLAAGSLSYGDQRRLEIARALASSPALLLLDEPAAGMNPTETRALIELIERLRAELGITILVIEHDMVVVREISDLVVVLDHGTRIAAGPPAEVARDPLVIEAYLGTPAS